MRIECANDGCFVLFQPMSPNAKYCSGRCKARAEKRRRTARGTMVKAAEQYKESEPDWFVTLESPTPEALEGLCQVYQNTPNANPSKVTGMIPVWSAPEDRIWMKDLVEDFWILS